MRNFASLAVAGVAAAALLAPHGSASAGIVRVGGVQTRDLSFTKPVSLGRVYAPTISYYRSHFNPRGVVCCHMTYGNGPVLLKPHMYLILWGYQKAGDPDGVQALLTAWSADYGGSTYGNIATQYYMVSGGKNVFPTNPKSNGTVWIDNANAIPAHPTDAQIQAEAWAAIKQFGNNQPDSNGVYVVNSAYKHDPQGFVTSGWCAYHGASTVGGSIIAYANEPYMPDGDGDCGANIITAPSDEPGIDEGETILAGHEFNEAQTDPQPFTGWDSTKAGEIGDACAWTNILNDKLLNSGVYTQQPIFSNKTNTCIHFLKKPVKKAVF
jgi:hypothetical protein